MNDIERQFLAKQLVARLATADSDGVPHVVPVCFTILESTIYIAIDQKPKSGDPRALKRIQNISSNPSVALIVDHYEDDWRQLAWVMLRGRRKSWRAAMNVKPPTRCFGNATSNMRGWISPGYP